MMTENTKREHKKKILAISSPGGHWTQLLRLRPAFEDSEVIYATTKAGSKHQIEGHRFYKLPDANKDKKFKVILLALHVLYVLLKERPDVIISTGAAHGYLALRLGKYLGAKTIWLESIANAQNYSLSTKMVRKYADLLLTQWPHMAQEDGPHYKGGVL